MLSVVIQICLYVPLPDLYHVIIFIILDSVIILIRLSFVLTHLDRNLFHGILLRMSSHMDAEDRKDNLDMLYHEHLLHPHTSVGHLVPICCFHVLFI